MAEPFKICPICDTSNHRNAMVCRMCGTTLAEVEIVGTDEQVALTTSTYDYRYGETDFLEETLNRKAKIYLGMIIVSLLLVMGGGLLLVFYPSLAKVTVEAATLVGVEVSVPLFQTNTPQPTRLFPTVTEGAPTLTPSYTVTLSPTVTPTSTRTPCMQTVAAGEGLYGVVGRCGHRHPDVIDLVVEINELNDETDIFAGQQLEIPWPTETPDPNATEEAVLGAQPETQPEAPESDAASDVNTSVALEEVVPTDGPSPTPTLMPGMAYHTVKTDENIISIGLLYNTNVEVLSQLNPEVTFSQCEFGVRFGGEACVVLLYEGQVIRVPAPTPTPTLSPTPSGSETATPTPTPTINAPNALSPDNREYFRKDEYVTLRWVTPGALAENERYMVRVENLTDGQIHIANTQDLFFVLPAEWQGRGSQRYEYVWTVSIIDVNRPDAPQYTTGALAFTWEGLGEEESVTTTVKPA